jgi:hypothetical protein
MTKKRVRGNPLPLIVEKHPKTYDGYPFITLIQYRDQEYLGIVDNTTDKMIKAYILDLCGPTQVNEERVINVATDWYSKAKDRYPLSFEFSKLGMSDEVKQIYRSYAVGFVTRVIGPLPRFEMGEVKSIKRRKRKAISSNIEVNNQKVLIID